MNACRFAYPSASEMRWMGSEQDPREPEVHRLAI